MTIVFVIDNYCNLTNGTTITAKRFVEGLRERGHTVRVVSIGVSGPDMYPVGERRIPIVSAVARRQSMFFAKPDRAVLRRAFEGADVVHFFMPFRLERVGKRLADRMGIPTTAAFHVQPENITYGARLGKAGRPAANFIYRLFKFTFYRRFDDIHCPSAFIAGELRRHGYRAKLHVISNGVGPQFAMREKEPNPDGSFDILMVGRYAPEKRQDLILKAIRGSRYADRINLRLAGAGPDERKLRRLASRLPRPVSFGFLPQGELLEALHGTDLYIHAADVEIEAISCLEAISSGLVPIISDSRNSATGQFALDGRSLFRAGSAEDLRRKIEYWIEHPAERREAALRYRDSAGYYRLDYSLKKAEGMFEEAILVKGRRVAERSPEGRRYRRWIVRPLVIRILSAAFYYVIVVPLIALILKLVLGVRIHGRKNLLLASLKGGAVTISNHVHTFDSVMAGFSFFPRRLVFTSLPSNFRLPVAGFLVYALGAVPVPRSPTESRIFFNELSRHARRGGFVHIFPEGELKPEDSELRPFKNGAFLLAVDAQVPVIPMALTFHRRRRGIGKLLGRNYIVFSIGEPIQPDLRLLKREAVKDLEEKAELAMRELLEKGKRERTRLFGKREA